MLVPHVSHVSEAIRINTPEQTILEEATTALVPITPFIAPALGPIRSTRHLLREHKQWLEQFNSQYALAVRQHTVCTKPNFAKEVAWRFLDEFFPTLSYLEMDRYHAFLWKVIFNWYNNNVNWHGLMHGRRRQALL